MLQIVEPAGVGVFEVLVWRMRRREPDEHFLRGDAVVAGGILTLSGGLAGRGRGN